LKKYGNQASEIKKVLISSINEELSLSEIVRLTKCSKTNTAALLAKWTETGHVIRTGNRGNYRYTWSEKDWRKKVKFNCVINPNRCQREIYSAIEKMNFECFTSGQIVESTGLSSTTVCRCLPRLAKQGILSQFGQRNMYVYKQIREKKVNIPPASAADFVFKIFKLTKNPFSVDEVTEMVLAGLLSRDNIYYSRAQVKNAVKHIIYCWCRDRVLICLDENEYPPLYRLKPGIKRRPVHGKC